MIVYIGLGSNLGDRRAFLKKAAQEVSQLRGVKILKSSHVYENPAMTLAEVSSKCAGDWDKAFLNSALKIQTSNEMTPGYLLENLKLIEKKLGRSTSEKWTARTIDLDILHIEGQNLNSASLRVPHPELKNRNFVTAPLRDLAPSLFIESKSPLDLNKSVKNPLPLWMAIANITPDSFSDGGKFNQIEFFKKKLSEWIKIGVHLVDVGAESTRPGAKKLSIKEEQSRLLPVLTAHSERSYEESLPKLSLDSRNFETQKWALKFKPNFINDVSGLADLRMLDLIKDSDCDYILMHSLNVPADPKKTLSDKTDAAREVKFWLEQKLEVIDKKNISLDRIVIDPGIGFGKSPSQSMELIRKLESFKSLGVRTLIGHSRKSFMSPFASDQAEKRDLESVGLSLALAQRGVDILRVHAPEKHIKAHQGFLYADPIF